MKDSSDDRDAEVNNMAKLGAPAGSLVVLTPETVLRIAENPLVRIGSTPIGAATEENPTARILYIAKATPIKGNAHKAQDKSTRGKLQNIVKTSEATHKPRLKNVALGGPNLDGEGGNIAFSRKHREKGVALVQVTRGSRAGSMVLLTAREPRSPAACRS